MRKANIITPSTIGLEFGERLTDHAWFLVTAADAERAAAEVCEALKGAERPHTLIDARSPNDLGARQPSDDQAGVVVGTWAWDDADYAALDRMRPVVRQRWPILVWVTSPEAAVRLRRSAPNFWSFFVPAVGEWTDASMSTEEIEARLRGLRERYGLSDEEVITRAGRGELPGDADHHFWLVLLGRGDLLPRSQTGS